MPGNLYNVRALQPFGELLCETWPSSRRQFSEFWTQWSPDIESLAEDFPAEREETTKHLETRSVDPEMMLDTIEQMVEQELEITEPKGMKLDHRRWRSQMLSVRTADLSVSSTHIQFCRTFFQ
jgi:hypothetical protein